MNIGAIDSCHQFDKGGLEYRTKGRFAWVSSPWHRCCRGILLTDLLGTGGIHGRIDHFTKESIIRILQEVEVLVGHGVTILLYESVDIICHIVGIMDNSESPLIETWFPEEISISRSW